MNSIRTTPEYMKLMMAFVKSAESHSGAHSGPAFLPWNREFLKRLELLIRQRDPSLYLPYWDSTLETALPDSRGSMLFTADFMGETDAGGTVISGFAKGWPTLQNTVLRRRIGLLGSAFFETSLQVFLKMWSIEKVLAFTGSKPISGLPIPPDWNSLEFTQNNVLEYINGDEAKFSSDPLVFLHLAFVDQIWEQWRMTKQLCSGPEHFRNASMFQFAPMKNIDGLTNSYTDELYKYASRPTCPDCGGSVYLFCDKSHGEPRCAAKVRFAGMCNGFSNGEKVCYAGQCDKELERCISTFTKKEEAPEDDSTSTTTLATTTEESCESPGCFNEYECCPIWVEEDEQQCRTNATLMCNCRVSCGICAPPYDHRGCEDFHQDCQVWASIGHCYAHPWMPENCRASCRNCPAKEELRARCSRHSNTDVPPPPGRGGY